MLDYEQSVSFLGTWGRFQRRVFFLLCLASIPSGYNLLSVIFLLATPPHHCSLPLHSNLSQDWVQCSIPVQHSTGESERHSCSRYELEQLRNLSALEAVVCLNQSLSAMKSGDRVLLPHMRQEGCEDGWDYSQEYFQTTVVTEFNLVCGDDWKQPLSSLVYFLGGLCGCFISGPASDRVGRKPVVFCAIAVLSIFSGALAFAPSWPVFAVLFFLVGLGQISSYIGLFVLGSEILIGPVRVLFCTMILPTCYVFGTMLLPGVAYFVRTWRHLSLTLALPGLACVPLWWLLPESPRWLASTGRQREAECLLRSAALENQVDAPAVIFLHGKTDQTRTGQKSPSFLDLLRTENIRHMTLIQWVIWFSLSVSSFGLAFNSSGLNGDPFLNYFLISAIEIPAYVTSWLLARCLPRRLSFSSFTLLGALALFLIQSSSNSTLTLFLVLVGKFGVLTGTSLMYVYSGELSPTSIRNTAMSSCATFSRMGSSISPYLMQLAVFYSFLPWIFVGFLSVISMFLSFFLPETFRQPLPDTIEELTVKPRFRWPWTSTPPPKDVEDSAKHQTHEPGVICSTHF